MANSKKAIEQKSKIIKVNFLHPTDGRVITVSLDSAMTSKEIIAELIDSAFIHDHFQGYGIAIKGGCLLLPNESLQKLGVRNGDVLRIIPATDAG